MRKLDLSDVTLCAAASTDLPLTARALEISQKNCRFKEAVLFTHEPVDGPFRVEKINEISSRAEYSSFIFKGLPQFIDSPFVLIIQWDGYVMDPAAWRPEFRECDYIGAKWHFFKDENCVGNGGFSLRSRKLLQALSRFFPEPGDIAEDVYIGRGLRPDLEKQHAIRFATESVANHFSYEYSEPECPTFGFHGLFNLWRHIEDAQMLRVIEQIPKFRLKTEEFGLTLMQYYRLRKFHVLGALYSRIREEFDLPALSRHLSQWILHQQVTDCLAACEGMRNSPPS